MLQDLDSNHLLIFLTLCPNAQPSFYNFPKARSNDFDSHRSSAEKYSSFSCAATLFTSLSPNAATFFLLIDRVNLNLGEVEDSVSKRLETFAAAHRSNENCQTYVCASRHASSDLYKAKAEVSQAICLFISFKSIYSLLHFIAGSFSSPSFPNCSPRESASV